MLSTSAFSQSTFFKIYKILSIELVKYIDKKIKISSANCVKIGNFRNNLQWNVWKLKFNINVQFCTKIEILNKNWDSGQKLEFWTKLEILDKNWNFDKSLNFFGKKFLKVKVNLRGKG